MRKRATFGPVLARCAAALKEATSAELVYVYVFGGGIPHLHVHLAPHVPGDALNEAMLRGEFEERPRSSGAVGLVSKDFPDVPREELVRVAGRVRSCWTRGAPGSREWASTATRCFRAFTIGSVGLRASGGGAPEPWMAWVAVSSRSASVRG